VTQDRPGGDTDPVGDDSDSVDDVDRVSDDGAAVPVPSAGDGAEATGGRGPLSMTERRRRALVEARRNGLPPKVDSWRRRTATGAVLTGFALGFQEALGQQPERAAVVMEAPGDPPTDLPVDAEVDQIRPADNVVRIRPWLLPNGHEAPDRGESENALTADGDGATAASDPGTNHDADAVSDTSSVNSPKPSTGYRRRLGRK
jgi:hypothetical protein